MFILSPYFIMWKYHLVIHMSLALQYVQFSAVQFKLCSIVGVSRRCFFKLKFKYIPGSVLTHLIKMSSFFNKFQSYLLLSNLYASFYEIFHRSVISHQNNNNKNKREKKGNCQALVWDRVFYIRI